MPHSERNGIVGWGHHQHHLRRRRRRRRRRGRANTATRCTGQFGLFKLAGRRSPGDFRHHKRYIEYVLCSRHRVWECDRLRCNENEENVCGAQRRLVFTDQLAKWSRFHDNDQNDWYSCELFCWRAGENEIIILVLIVRFMHISLIDFENTIGFC